MLGASPAEITYEKLKSTVDWAIRDETRFLSNRMERAGVDLYFGVASFKNEREISVAGDDEKSVYAEKIIIASGSKAARPGGIPFNGRTIIDSDEILADPAKAFVPRDMIILGGGVIAMEYATIFALLGVKVYVLSRSASVLSFVDGDLLQVVLDSAKEMGAEIRGGARLDGVVERGGHVRRGGRKGRERRGFENRKRRSFDERARLD
jgi:NAD(P) transhydrogenase